MSLKRTVKVVKKFMQSAVKRPGALRKELGTVKGKIPVSRVTKTITKLKKASAGGKKLPSAKRRLLRQAVLARTFKKFRKGKAA
jgi:hypothetical protein